MKNKFKLTPEIHKEISNVCLVLPNLVKLNANGSKQFRIITKTIKGIDVSIHDRKTITDFKENNFYTQKLKEPVLVNHKVEMIRIYQTQGYSYVLKYIEYVNELTKPTEPTETLTK